MTNNTVYVWKGDDEEWQPGKGQLLYGRGLSGGSSVPVSSGILDYCREYERSAQNKKKEVQPETWIHDMFAAGDRNVNIE